MDEKLGLALGADDYVVKAFDFDVLLERIKLALRHCERAAARGEESSKLLVGDMTIDRSVHAVTVADRTVRPAAFRAAFLWRHRWTDRARYAAGEAGSAAKCAAADPTGSR